MAENYDLMWDAEIEDDGIDFVLLDEGTYEFEVTNFERGASKASGSPMAILTLRVDDRTTLTERIVLTKKTEWKVSQFFVSIGMKKRGEKIKMEWDKVVGKTGSCEVIIEEYVGNDGQTRETNRVSKFLSPQQADAITSKPQTKTWQAGKF